ncbi:LADA_0F11914g1_1 [Lachancea dasiensis]|uniref:LADA_0F11914g1_1 n=1 Tax=Lachancea dasiensis TaxID=1072105 RepID=A0A1G4JMA4_9SACH|nr:LADA_0F11914g1_1 [Lachancea dasiensis]
MRAIKKIDLGYLIRYYGKKSSTASAKDIVLRTQAVPRALEPIVTADDAGIIKNTSEIRPPDRNINDLASRLFEHYNSGYLKIAKSTLSSVNHFFNAAKVSYEWSASSFMDIPGEKLREKMELQTLKNSLSGEVEDNQHAQAARKFPGKTDGVPFELLNGLPEVVFLGRCNSGKSTLLNNLTTEFSTLRLNNYAKSSSKAGFTKTINCFNVGKRFRLIDTPGYGIKGTQQQGEVIMQYLRKRRELKRTFLIVSAEQGFAATDSQIVDFLMKFGIPFEVVFTKLDKVKRIDELHNMIQESGVLELPTMPQMLFVNSISTSKFPKRLGIDRLRAAILESCGLKPGVRPLKLR